MYDWKSFKSWCRSGAERLNQSFWHVSVEDLDLGPTNLKCQHTQESVDPAKCQVLEKWD